jgi:hypothetical protein
MKIATQSIEVPKASESVSIFGHMAPPASQTLGDDKLAIGYNARGTNETLMRRRYISHMAVMCISPISHARPDRVASYFVAEMAQLSPTRRPFTATSNNLYG